MSDSAPGAQQAPKLTADERATYDVLRYFAFSHLPEDLQEVARPVKAIADQMAETLRGRELVKGLDALLVAKDCFVRAKLSGR